MNVLKPFVVTIVETTFLVHPFTDNLEKFCHDFITDNDHEYEITITEDDIEYEKAIFFDNYGYYFKKNYMYEEYAMLRKVTEILCVHKDTVLFHASSLQLNDRAYLFTAVSGTGKTTHAKMWIEKYPTAVMINDDKPFVQLKDNKLTVYGNPWNGKTGIGNNINAQLGGILCLYQAANNETREMNDNEKWDFLFKQVYRPNNALAIENTLKIINYIINNITIYALKCNKEEEAAEVAYRALINKEDQNEA